MEKIDSKYDVNAYVESRIGGRNENQDSYGYADTPFGFLVVVCDGMGGLNGGKTASTIAVSTIVDYISKCEESGSIPVLLSKAITEANREIIATASSDMSLKGMGTTATVLLINENAAYAAHVGDSRIYQVRNGKKIFRTFDHSMVFELVKKKVITEEQARLSAQSNIITRALGVRNEVVVDTATLHYRKGDRFVLCSDGFHSVMPEKDFLHEIGAKGELNLIIDNFAEKIDNIGKENGGGHDNLTAAVVEVKTTTPVEKKKCITFSAAIAVVISIIIALLCYERTEKKEDGEKTVISHYKFWDSTSPIRKEEIKEEIFENDSITVSSKYKYNKKTGEFIIQSIDSIYKKNDTTFIKRYVYKDGKFKLSREKTNIKQSNNKIEKNQAGKN